MDEGQNKAEAARLQLKERFPASMTAFPEFLTIANARRLLQGSSCIVDCCDSANTRYTINDAAVAEGIPVVVASALQWEGQLLISRPNRCYRCCFEEVPREEDCGACALFGVVGPVVGVMGLLQATETLKLLAGLASQPNLLIYNALDCKPFRIVPLNPKPCFVCEGGLPTRPLPLPGPAMYPDTISASDFAISHVSLDGEKVVVKGCVLDVRPPNHFSVWNAKGATSYPLDRLQLDSDQRQVSVPGSAFVICRRGVDSNKACWLLAEAGCRPVNVVGGWHSVALSDSSLGEIALYSK
ncbi:MAG: hypothetical protein KVP17_004304 [Porospora cf. gigantea B]|nr:MAG: hypothetical protein KVP17_004304 [Porospora cf. gigantea B]